MATSDRSISDILQDAFRNLQTIVRSEVQLAKTELREEIVKAKSAAPGLAVGATSGFFCLLFLLLAIMYALALAVPTWAAALILAVILGATAAATLNAGLKQLKRVHPVPTKTVESMKENAEWARQQIK
jgi:uncharacterized protein (DUF2062 family)